MTPILAPVTPIVAGGSFSFSANGADQNLNCTTLNYQLQYSTSGANGSWNNFGATYDGATINQSLVTVTGSGWSFPTSGTYVISNIPLALNGLYIRVDITDESGASVASNSISLVVKSQAWLVDSDPSVTPLVPSGETFERSVLLPSGHVLALGNLSTNLYIDTTPGVSGGVYDTWAAAASLPNTLQRPSATVLPTGEVLIAGGLTATGADSQASYIFAEASAALTSNPNLMITPRDSHSATLLQTGKVLVAGGVNNGLILSKAEVFDPATWQWKSTGRLNYARYHHTATALQDGTVLVAGGNDSSDPTSAQQSAEIYSPASGTWTVVGDLNFARAYHTATLLPDGRVLIAGGLDDAGTPLNTAEIYDPAEQQFFPVAATLTAAREQATATLMASGSVLIAGGGGLGTGNTYLSTSEYFTPTAGGTLAADEAGIFTATAPLNTARDRHASVLVRDGDVVAAGGTTIGQTTVAEAEKFQDANGGTPTVPDATVQTYNVSGVANNYGGGIGNVAIGQTVSATCGPVYANGTTTQTGTTFTWVLLNATPLSGLSAAYPNWPDTAKIVFTVNNPSTYSATAPPDPFFSTFPNGVDVGLYCLATSNLGINAISSVAAPTLEQITYTYVPSVVITPNAPASADTVVQGKNITFTATVTNGQPGATDSFVWQYSKNGGTSWLPLAGVAGVTQGTSVTSGTPATTKTDTLTITGALEAWNGYQIEVTATDPDGVVTSNIVTLHVVGTPVLPALANVNVMIDGTQANVNDGGFQGYYFDGPRVGSGDAGAIANQPLTVAVPSNTTGAVTYQWCTGTATPAPFTASPTPGACDPNVVANGNGSGATSATFQPDVADAAGVGGPTSYYVVVTDTLNTLASTTVSPVVKYTVNEEPSVSITNSTGDPNSSYPTLKAGSPLTLTAVLNNGNIAGGDFPVAIGSDPIDFTSAKGYQYEWQYEQYGSYSWRDFPSSYLNGDGSSLTIPSTQLFTSGVLVRVAVTNTGWPGYGNSPLDTDTFVAYPRQPDHIQVDGAPSTVTVTQTSPIVGGAPATPYFGQTVVLTATSVQPTNEFADTTIYSWFKGTPPNGTAISSGSTGNPGGCPSTYTISGSSTGSYWNPPSNNNTLTITSACLLDAGNYYAVATNTIYDSYNFWSPSGYNATASQTSNTLGLAVNWGETTNYTSGEFAAEAADARYDALSLQLPDGTFWIAGGEDFATGLLKTTAIYTPSTGVWGASVDTYDTPSNTGSWTAGPNLQYGPHLDGTATLFLGGSFGTPAPYILVAGGSDASGDGTSGVEYYDVTNQAFQAAFAALAQPLTQQVGALLPTGNILLIGGQNGNADTFYNNGYLVTPGSNPASGVSGTATATVTPSVASLSIARAGSKSVTLDDGRILILGGEDAGGIDNAVDIYDTSAVNFANLPTVNTVYPPTLYHVSGVAGDFVAQGDSTYATAGHPVTGVFPAVMLSPRLYETATLLNDGRVLIAGGMDNTGTVISSIEIFDPTVNKGAGGFYALGTATLGGVAAATPSAAKLVNARAQASAVLLQNGSVLIFGGVDNNGNALNTAEVVDPNWTNTPAVTAVQPTATWLTNSLNFARAQASSTLLPSGLVLTAGGATATATAPTAEVFNSLESSVNDPVYATAPPAPGSSTLVEKYDVTLTLFPFSITSNYDATITAPVGLDFPTVDWNLGSLSEAVGPSGASADPNPIFTTGSGSTAKENYQVYLEGASNQGTNAYPIYGLVIDQYQIPAVISNQVVY